MITHVIDVLARCWWWLVPFRVIADYERAVVLRLGCFRRLLSPGLHWVRPLGIDQVLIQCIAWNTTALHDQALVTADHHQVSVSGIITWRVNNVRKFLLDVTDQDSVLADVTYGSIAVHVRSCTWEQLTDAEYAERLSKEVRKRAFTYGIEVKQVQFANVTKSKAIRLLGVR